MVRSYRYEMELHPYYEKPLKWERNKLKRKNRHKNKTIFEYVREQFGGIYVSDNIRGVDYFYCE